MASSFIEQNDVPIFRLPDELLMKICSYITSIKQKMELEQICPRFNRISSHPTSWKGVHSLQLMINCYTDVTYEMCCTEVCKTACDFGKVHLNGVAIPIKKWPSAIHSFLQRTEIHQFTLHYMNTESRFDRLCTVIFPRITEIFVQNRAKMKIRTLEIHCIHKKHRPSEGFKTFFLDLWHSVTPYLQELHYFAWGADYIRAGICIWPFIQKCNKLKSISLIDGNTVQINYDALMGKPLTEIVLPAYFLPHEFEEFVNVINGVSSDGLQSLTIRQFEAMAPEFVKYLSDHLTENSRKKLNTLFISGMDSIHCLSTFPFLFPNLEFLNMETVELYTECVLQQDISINQFFVIIKGFFDLTHDGLVTRRFTIQKLIVSKEDDLTELKTTFPTWCHDVQVDGDFGEMQPTPYVYLSKGKSSLIIRNIIDNSQLGSDNDFDMDGDEDDDYEFDDDYSEYGDVDVMSDEDEEVDEVDDEDEYEMKMSDEISGTTSSNDHDE